jgi:protein-disulfide isomerase
MIALVVLSGVVFTFLDRRGGESNEIPVAIQNLSQENNGEAIVADVIEEEDFGIVFNKEASPKINIWEDPQCPYCKMFEDSFGSYIEDLKRSGSAQVVYHMASFLGQESVRAANASYCAVPQGRFIEFHKAIYAVQGAEGSGIFSNKNLVEMGKRLGISNQEFEKCVNDGEYTDVVRKVYDSMKENGVESTPTVFINGKLWRPSGSAFNLDEFKAAVEAAR